MSKKQDKDLPSGIVRSYDTDDVDYAIRTINGLQLTELHHVRKDFPDYFQVDRYVIEFHVQGTVEGQINLQNIHMQSPCVLVLLPEFVMHMQQASADSRMFIISFDHEYASTLNLPSLPFRMLNNLHQQALFRFTEEQMQTARNYFDLLHTILQQGQPDLGQVRTVTLTSYEQEAARGLIYSLIRYMQGQFAERFEERHPLSRAAELTSDFLSLAEKECVRQRSIAWYADRLNVTPKHLANVVKQSTGRTVGSCLNEYTLLRAKTMLTTTTLNIQQISDALSFQNQSHFGTWFKRGTGKSPKYYRKNGQNK